MLTHENRKEANCEEASVRLAVCAVVPGNAREVAPSEERREPPVLEFNRLGAAIRMS